MKIEHFDCENCFKYDLCINGTNKYCIILDETLEPFKMIMEACKEFKEECERCPINKDCIKTTTNSANPIYWEREED